jgi:hypothetical protein
LKDATFLGPTLTRLNGKESGSGIDAVGKLASCRAGGDVVAVRRRILNGGLLSGAKTRRRVDDDGHSSVGTGSKLDAKLIGTVEVGETVAGEDFLKGVDAVRAEHLLNGANPFLVGGRVASGGVGASSGAPSSGFGASLGGTFNEERVGGSGVEVARAVEHAGATELHKLVGETTVTVAATSAVATSDGVPPVRLSGRGAAKLLRHFRVELELASEDLLLVGESFAVGTVVEVVLVVV